MLDVHLALPHLAVPLRLLLPLFALSMPMGPEAPAPATDNDLERLLTPLLERAWGYALRLTRNQADAEDLVQEAALRACRGFHGFQAGTNFKAWFFRILTHCFYERHRRRTVETESVELDDLPELFLYEQTAELGLHRRSPDPAQDLLGRLDVEEIVEALGRLPEDYRVAATLYFMDDHSYEEIAGILGVPVGTVRSRLHRGRRILQQELWKVAQERGIISRMQREAQ